MAAQVLAGLHSYRKASDDKGEPDAGLRARGHGMRLSPRTDSEHVRRPAPQPSVRTNSEKNTDPNRNKTMASFSLPAPGSLRVPWRRWLRSTRSWVLRRGSAEGHLFSVLFDSSRPDCIVRRVRISADCSDDLGFHVAASTELTNRHAKRTAEPILALAHSVFRKGRVDKFPIAARYATFSIDPASMQSRSACEKGFPAIYNAEG